MQSDDKARIDHDTDDEDLSENESSGEATTKTSKTKANGTDATSRNNSGSTKDSENDSNEEDKPEDEEDNGESEVDEEIKPKGKSKRTKENKEKLIAEMSTIEEEYALLKSRLHEYRLEKVEEYLTLSSEGLLPRYLAVKKETEIEIEKALNAAEYRKRLKIINLDHQNACATQAAHNNYEHRTTVLLAKMRSKLKSQLAQAEREKEEMDRPYVPDPMPEPTVRGSYSSRSKKLSYHDQYGDSDMKAMMYMDYNNYAPPTRKRKRPTSEDPLVVYMLTKEDIFNDFQHFS